MGFRSPSLLPVSLPESDADASGCFEPALLAEEVPFELDIVKRYNQDNALFDDDGDGNPRRRCKGWIPLLAARRVFQLCFVKSCQR